MQVSTISSFLTLLSCTAALAILEAKAESSVQWGNCSSNVPLATPALQCAELLVPLNWSEPQGETITLGLTRIRPKNDTRYIGSLLFNPGGPGQSASLLVAGQAAGFPLFGPAIEENFHIVGMDPRGVGLSTPVVCNETLWNKRNKFFPTSADEFQSMVEINRAAWESCENMTGPLLHNIDTKSVVQDFEALRKALGEDKINLFGQSYGTQIANTYAAMYPDKYRVIAMDAIVNHNESTTDLFAGQALAYEYSFGRFATWCSETPNCTLHDRDVKKLFTQLVTNATATPIPAPGCTTSTSTCHSNITGEEILFLTQQLLLFKDPFPPQSTGWAGLAAMLGPAATGNATALSEAYATQYLATTNTSTLFAGQAVGCLDFTNDLASYSDLAYRVDLGAYIAPVTRGASETYLTQTRCVGFPFKPTNPQTDMSVPRVAEGNNTNHNATTAAPILLSAVKYDPNLPLTWAHNARESIEGSVLVVRDGDGHTSYFLRGETAEIIDSYLVNMTLPEPNTVVDS
jgi:pimeloyl-ACP methyl ester carboxylesterase